MARTLRVFLGGREVGSFGQDDNGRQAFRYLSTYLDSADAQQLSLSLPLCPEPFGDDLTRAFFAGLLPDDDLRNRLGQYLGVSAHNEFALLAEVGRECAGAIEIVPEDEEWPRAHPGRLEMLSDSQLLAVLEQLPRRPLFVGENLRLSLAGAQDKMAVRMVKGSLALPLAGLPSTHILKTAIAGYEASVANEFFCMRLARELTLPVAEVSMRRVGEIEILLVERYDRRTEPNGTVQRLHQEDICQALGLPPTLKYQAEGGPDLARIFELLTEHALRPAIDRLSLLRWVVFNFLIGNADAHGKNVSILHRRGRIALAPFYDLMCTAVYPKLSSKMAMKIGSKYRFEAVEARHFAKLARDSGLAPAQVLRICRELAQAIPKAAREIAALPEVSEIALIARIVSRIERGAQEFEKKLRP